MRVGVIMGGISSEKEVSLMTGREIANGLDKVKYEVQLLDIGRRQELVEKTKGLDFAFIALHGCFGEDGIVQGTLEALGIPYSGCGVLSSAVCMNKATAKRILASGGITTPSWFSVKSLKALESCDLESLGYPLVVKPNSGGSSIGVVISANKQEVFTAVKDALSLDTEVIIEQYIQGDEITCSFLNGSPLPVIAIKPRARYFDYISKYSDGGAYEYAVELEEPIRSRVLKAASAAYTLLKCSVYARVDMIIRDGLPYVLEVNTLPGMTKNSLLPKSAKAAGISFSELLDLIIQYSIKERGYAGMA